MSKLNWRKTACAVLVLCAATAIASPAQTFTTLFSFNGANGGGAYAGLIQATDGNLYGTDEGGNDGNYGTVFRISPNGTLTTLYNFEENGPNGSNPYAALVQDTDGNFYGTTLLGGKPSSSCTGVDGCGTVFKITPSGALMTLHSFDQTDGYFPVAGLVQGTDGNLYGQRLLAGPTTTARRPPAAARCSRSARAAP